ncbi:MAG: ABC transporter permease [Roseiflexaceae bacterium]
MARVALPPQWAGALVRQRGPLRTYQWLWLLFCTLSALAVAAPRILSQPVIYTTAATVRIDAGQRYRQLYANEGRDFGPVQEIALRLLRLDYPELGSPTLGARYEPQPDGTVVVVAVARDPAQAQALADDAAEALARSVRAAGGREIFRGLMGWEEYAALSSAAPRTPFQRSLREIGLYSAFPLNRPVDVVSVPFTADQLAPDDLSDLARAFEVRDQELSRIDLPAARAAAGPAAAQLNASSCAALAGGPGHQPQAERDVCRLELGLRALRDGLGYLQRDLGAVFDPDAASVAYRSQRAAAGALVDRRIVPLLGLAALVGLLFGGLGVAVDRSAGVMAKLRELWNYRELIRNLVLRDLRVRYKGSALGYLWTQLAPLLMMLVFWFVFSYLQPQPIAMFPVFLIVGLLAWNFCNEAVAGGARSVIDNASLIKKVFFPREVLPLVSVLSSLANYLLSLPMMFLVIAVSQLLYPALGELRFSWTFLYLPVLLVIQTLFLAGVALFMSALAVFFRDVVHLIGILLQFWFFLTPVVYSLDGLNPLVAQAIRWLNPMASLVDFYREVLYGRAVNTPLIPTPGLPALTSVLRVLVTAVLALALGYWFFQRRSGRFGEQI